MVSNVKRAELSREKLIAAARRLIGENGFNQTSTPEIAKVAGVSRGALYHHFEDKQALFQAVVEAELLRVRDAIESVKPMEGDTLEMEGDILAILIEGGCRFMDAMSDPITTQILLLDGPAVLGTEVIREIDERTTTASLREGISIAQAENILPMSVSTDALTSLMTGAYDRAVLDIAAGTGDRASVWNAMEIMWRGLAALTKE